MGVIERRAREKEELRGRILTAATELFVEQGFANVSIRKIAEKIEYSPTTIYLYFKDKAELMGSICYQVFDELAIALNAIGDKGLPPLERMRESLVCFGEFALRHPDYYTVVFCLPEPVELTSILKDGVHRDPGMEMFDRLRTTVAECMSRGELRNDDVEMVSQQVFTMVHGVAAALVTMKTFPFVDKPTLVRRSVDTVLRGLGAAV